MPTNKLFFLIFCFSLTQTIHLHCTDTHYEYENDHPYNSTLSDIAASAYESDFTTSFTTVDDLDYDFINEFECQDVCPDELYSRKNALLIGAESNLIAEIAKKLAKKNYTIGFASPSVNRINQFTKKLKVETFVKKIDISKNTSSVKMVKSLIDQMGGIDLCIYIPYYGPKLGEDSIDFAVDKKIIESEVTGFSAITSTVLNYFLCQDSGRFAYVTPVGTVRPNPKYPTYNATKAFSSRYLANIYERLQTIASPVTITEIRIGYLDDPDYIHADSYWSYSPRKAAGQILKAIKSGEPVAYINKKWKLIGTLMNTMPNWLYNICGNLYTQ